MMTRYEWLLLRKRQGHNIITCSCGYSTPEYLFWMHEWDTGHYIDKPFFSMKESNGSQKFTQAS